MKEVLTDLIKQANQKKILIRPKKTSWKLTMAKGIGMAAITGAGIYGLAKKSNFLRETVDSLLHEAFSDNSGGLQQCINQCRSVMKDIETLSLNTNDIVVQSTLEESAHHLKMCLHECEFAQELNT